LLGNAIGDAIGLCKNTCIYYISIQLLIFFINY